MDLMYEGASQIMPVLENAHTPKFTYLKDSIDFNISTLKVKVKGQKNKAQWINGSSIVLGALITLTLGFKVEGYAEVEQNIALLLGALLTIVNAWAAVFDYRKLWVRQKSTLLDLYHLRNELSFKLSIDDTSDESAMELFKQYQEIWERDSNEWRNIIYKPQTTKKDDTVTNG